MSRRFAIEEKLQILTDLARAGSQREKSEILRRHGLKKQTVHKWRVAYREGRLGARPGRKTDPAILRILDQAIIRPRVLTEIRKADVDLVSDQRVPEPAVVKQGLVEEMVDLIDDEVVPWSGAEGPDWHERAAADISSRISKRQGKLEEGEPTFVDATCDYLGDVPTNTPAEACRDPKCPCRRICSVHHHHREDWAPDGRSLLGGLQQPPVIVCTSRSCEINRYCLSWTFGSPFHVHWPRVVPERDLDGVEAAISWRSREDCPWHEVCDIEHERPDDSVMEVAAAVQNTWQPVRLWCVAPTCKHHRPGAPHMHCRDCGQLWPAFIRYREIDLETVSRVGGSDADGLCERCYFEWKKILIKEEEPS
jgi:transposase-like protein